MRTSSLANLRFSSHTTSSPSRALVPCPNNLKVSNSTDVTWLTEKSQRVSKRRKVGARQPPLLKTFLMTSLMYRLWQTRLLWLKEVNMLTNIAPYVTLNLFQEKNGPDTAKASTMTQKSKGWSVDLIVIDAKVSTISERPTWCPKRPTWCLKRPLFFLIWYLLSFYSGKTSGSKLLSY